MSMLEKKIIWFLCSNIFYCRKTEINQTPVSVTEGELSAG